MRLKSFFTVLTVTVAFFTLQSQAQIKILSGFESGSYNQMVNDIKRIVDTTIKITPTDGSYYNFMQLRNLHKNGFDICLLQYDVLFAGTYGFEELKKIQNIRALLPLGKEDVHLITKKGNNIKGINDLNGKKVAIGGANTGANITARFIKDFTKIKWIDVVQTYEESVTALIKGDIQAFIYVGVAPVPYFSSLDKSIKDQLMLASIDNAALDKVYTKKVIKAGTYDWVTEDVTTVSVGFAMATNITDEKPGDVEKLTKLLTGIKANIEKLKAEGHPGWQNVDFNFTKINSEIHDASKKVFNLK